MSVQLSDGQYPNRMALSLWNGPASISLPERDATMEAETILHEYTHAMVQRLVGHGAGVEDSGQPFGLNEGWASFYLLALLSQSQDDPGGCYAFAACTTYLWLKETTNRLDQNYYFGLTLYPYCTNMTNNPLTLKDIDPAQVSLHAGIPCNPVYTNPSPSISYLMNLWAVTLW